MFGTPTEYNHSDKTKAFRKGKRVHRVTPPVLVAICTRSPWRLPINDSMGLVMLSDTTQYTFRRRKIFVDRHRQPNGFVCRTRLLKGKNPIYLIATQTQQRQGYADMVELVSICHNCYYRIGRQSMSSAFRKLTRLVRIFPWPSRDAILASDAPFANT